MSRLSRPLLVLASGLLLNVTANSWPAAGSIAIAIAFGLGAMALLGALRNRGAIFNE